MIITQDYTLIDSFLSTGRKRRKESNIYIYSKKLRKKCFQSTFQNSIRIIRTSPSHFVIFTLAAAASPPSIISRIIRRICALQ
mmetsp:Transcript_12548/g.19422  ORF Transcript_12548/g.19422 Transcript_12548/m.19422 type:complete len:83 (+) Transcript_12548:64-312(+)